MFHPNGLEVALGLLYGLGCIGGFFVAAAVYGGFVLSSGLSRKEEERYE